MATLDEAVGAFARKEMSRNEFETAIALIIDGFKSLSDAEITAYMDVEFSGAYSDSESIYVYYEVTENTEAEEIIGTPSRIRLSRHAARN